MANRIRQNPWVKYRLTFSQLKLPNSYFYTERSRMIIPSLCASRSGFVIPVSLLSSCVSWAGWFFFLSPFPWFQSGDMVITILSWYSTWYMIVPIMGLIVPHLNQIHILKSQPPVPQNGTLLGVGPLTNNKVRSRV